MIELAVILARDWEGKDVHDGWNGVCSPAPSAVTDGGALSGVADPRCWPCLSWLAEDSRPIRLRDGRSISGEERAELIALLRSRLA